MDTDSHCTMCDRPDNVDNLVQCDKCDRYAHFSCAGVNDSIADPDRSFTCKRCIELEETSTDSSSRTSRHSRSTSRTSISARRLALKMQQLELERQSRLKELDDAEKFQRLRRQVEEEFNKQRFEALEEQLCEDDEEERSVRSRVSSRVVRENTGRWLGAVNLPEGLIATTSAITVASTSHADGKRCESLGGSHHGRRSKSRRTTPAASVAEVRLTQPGEVAKALTDERAVMQQIERHTEPIEIQVPVHSQVSNVVNQQEAVVPVPDGLSAGIAATDDATEGDRSGPGTQLEPAMSNMYRVTCMGKTTVHYGIPTKSGQSVGNQVRGKSDKLTIGLQPVVEEVKTSTPNQLIVVTNKSDKNSINQLGTTISKQNKTETARLLTSQGQFPQPPLPKAKPRAGQPPPGSHASAPVLPPGNIRQNLSNPFEPLPSSGHEQVIDPNASVILSQPRFNQCTESIPSMPLPPPGQAQYRVSYLPSSVQQSSLDHRPQWKQPVLQPSGYESFMREPTMQPARSTDFGGATSVQPCPVGQRHEFEANLSSSIQHRETFPSSQDQQGTNLLNQPLHSEVPRDFGQDQSPLNPGHSTVPMMYQSQPASVVPQSGNRHPEVNELQVGQQAFFVPNSSLFVPPPGRQQVSVPTSSVLLPPSGQQQYRTSSNAMAPEPPPGPEQPFVSGNQSDRPVPVLPNVPDPRRPRSRGPTAEQLAARQVIPRELPVFSGDPLDWPLFFSSFRNSTDACGYNDAENLARLQRCLRGHALDSVRSRLLIPESVPHVMATLERLYGRPEVIIRSLLRRMREIPSPKGDDLKTLINFGMGVGNLVDHMILADQQQHISNPMLLQELVDRLPPNLKLQWASYKRSHYDVNLAIFNDFMKDLVTMASDVTPYVDMGSQSSAKSEKVGRRDRPAKEKLFVHQEAASTVSKPSGSTTSQKEGVSPVSKTCLHCDKPDHRIAECPDFKKLNMDERWKVMRQKGLCRLCLIPHRTWPCRSKQQCGIGDCRMRHHPLLHSKKPELNTSSPSTSSNQNVVHQHHHSLTSSALLRYIPVTLYGNGKTVDVYAFLDDGSSSTLLEGEVANLLGVKGPSESLCLCWTNDVKRIEKGSQRIEIAISGRNEKRSFPLRARTVEQLKLPSQTLVYSELCELHPHLRNLPMSGYADVAPQLIIGVDNAKMICALKSRECGNGELVAAKTRLGWCIYGRCTTTKSHVEYVNAHVEPCEKEADMHDLFRQFMAIDEASIKVSPQSDEDKRALKILQETTRRVDGRLETGLLWCCDEPNLPNSYPMAVRRMEALEKKLSKDPELNEKVRGQIADYLEKGYAHRITAEEWESTEPGRVWYLPLGVVRNPNKPGKVRLIWDAAARVDGVSFNDMMLKGPDMLTALTTVLLRFRQKRIAFSGDIKEMFHQFLIRLRDRQAQRFVFRECPGQPPQIFVMDVATFGAACSPCIAQYLKNRNAEEYAEQFPDAARAIIENHYVDDYLDSAETIEEAVKLINEVKRVHAKAGMEIRNFSSNSIEVLERVGESSKVQQKSLIPTATVERVLGMVWRPSEDVFSFEVNLKKEVRNIVESQGAPTKRQVLRTIMSLYDPLGLVAHFSVHGKILMQRIWRAGIGWDETISGEILEEWQQWISVLMKIGEVSVPRCFFSGTSATPKDSQIHVFVDASENAYACVAYIRSMCNGTPRCTLIAAKTKVAPLKPLSIPRLELQAALIGSRLLDNICNALTIPVAARFLWSDSTTVLAWLKSETRRYHQFVGFRVGEILSTSTVDEWQKVPTKVNVADQATKWRDGPSFKPDDWWYAGPSFLREPDENWRTGSPEEFSTTEDLRAVFLHHRVVTPPIIDVSRFSKWSKLQRSTAYVIRAMKRFLGLRAEGPPTQEELQMAETLIWQQVQEEVYAEELAILRYNKDHPKVEPKSIDRMSALYRMSPMLDDDGVLRMNSRIAAAPLITKDARLPILLPKRHRAVELLVESYHNRFLHGNHETVVNEIRQRFYIPKLRVVVRKVAKQCQYCRVQKVVPRAPIMAPLPEIRLTAFVRPFTHTGVDYFGPVFVKQGRSLVKRWIALFTCLSVRAVHLEIAHSLSTQSCVMAIRRFVARRGCPATFISDNGTNFVGASNLLKEQLKVINEHCAVTFTNTSTRWLFNPPLAPHMGGPWERMVRSVKMAMASIAEHPHHPSDEVLETVALEAESIVNSRPLTYIALDHSEQEALTPNHFLLYGIQGVNQPSRDLVDYASLRDSWKLAQYLVDTFWRRWIREYLPTLTRRTKWFQPVKPLKPGDLVVVVDEGKRNGWLRGRILRVVTGRDGQVRRAEVQTSKGIVCRPATKLALLDVREAYGEQQEDCPGVPELHGRGNVAEPTVQSSLVTTGYLGSFLSNSLKTNQLEVNTDSKTLRPIARLKEPRELFALPKERDYDCPQQAPRWPIECQVQEERVYHINYAPESPEPYYQPTGKELQPRPVGEENGVIVYNYNPTSAVHYDYDSSSSSSSPSPPRLTPQKLHPSNSDSISAASECRDNKPQFLDDDDDETDDDEDSDASNNFPSGQDRWSDRFFCSPVLDLDDDSNWHYFGYSDDEASGSSTDTDTEDNGLLRYGPSEYNLKLTTDQMNEESEIFMRSQLRKLTLEQPHPQTQPHSQTSESSSKDEDEDEEEDEAEQVDNSSSSASPVQKNCPTPTPAQNFYASDPETDNDSEGEQSKHEIKSAPTLLHLNSTAMHHNSKNNNPPNTDTLSSTLDDGSSPTTSVPQFSRSTVGGSKAQPTAHPNAFDPDDLVFESRFESGNLGRAIKITPTYYELYLRPDMYTNRHTQWFYFRVKNTKAKMVYRFSIINLTKPDSLYKEGMRPLMYSTLCAEYNNIGWQRCGENIAYFRNDSENGYNHSNYHHRPIDDDDEEFVGNASFTLSFNIEFKYDDDTVYFAHSYPYTYSDLQDYLMSIQRNPVKSKFCKLRLLCRSLAGNNVYYLTVTAPSTHEDDNQKKKKAVIISARVHPGESPSSWMMKGLMDFITGDSYVAKKLRHKFIFKLVPMLNPDGVIVGNTRSSLTGRDLNRQYRTVIRETYPSIWNTKAMIRRLMEDCGVAMYCDMHAHSRKHNVFIYGCENLKRHPDRRLLEQVFPLMLHKNVADKFSFENCKFKVQKNKEGTGRIVVWVLGVTNSYTLEASFGGSTMGGRAGTHFSTADYEHIGRAYCETLMDYYDDNPIKEKLRMKILTRLSKEGSSAEEPLNIPLSDYSSDEGDTSTSSSEDEAGKDSMAELEGPCCSSLRVPPSSPVLPQKFKGNKKGKKQSHTPTRLYRRRTRNAHRIVLDIPTAEPASDFFEYSSEEESSPVGDQPHQMAVSDTENTIRRSFRRHHKFRQSERIKKLTMLGCETQYLMPPELIVRSATSRYMSEEEEDDNNRMVMSIIKEFPPISKERSWQGFNRRSAERNRAEMMKPMSPDHIFAHLSFKRSIWTGTHSDGYVNETTTINSRPLSWGVPPVLVKSTYFDSEALLTACSQKLAAWKDEKRSLKEKHHKSMSRLAAKDKENRSAASSAATRVKLSLADQYNGGKQRASSDKKHSDSSEGSGMAKVRRKTRSTLNKIVEKAEIITHLSRSARSGHSRRMAVAAAASLLSSSGSPRKATSTSNLLGPVSGSQTQLLVSSQSLKTPIHTGGGNKFKTGGIVVTAAQPLHSKQRKTAQGHLRAVRTPSNAPSSTNNNQSSSTSPTKLPTTTTIDIQLTTLCSETESEKNVKIVRKHKKKHRIGNRDKSAAGRVPA